MELFSWVPPICQNNEIFEKNIVVRKNSKPVQNGLKHEKTVKNVPNYDPPSLPFLPPTHTHTNSGQNHGVSWTSRWLPMKML